MSRPSHFQGEHHQQTRIDIVSKERVNERAQARAEAEARGEVQAGQPVQPKPRGKAKAKATPELAQPKRKAKAKAKAMGSDEGKVLSIKKAERAFGLKKGYHMQRLLST
jgi:hypothetical protein